MGAHVPPLPPCCPRILQNSTALPMCEPTGDGPPAASWQTPITPVGGQSCRIPPAPGPGHGPPDSGGTCWPVPTPRPCHTNSRRRGGPSMVAPSLPQQPSPEESETPPTPAPAGPATLPSAEGRGMADRSFFTGCWCFGESLPLRTAGPTAAASEGCSEAGPGSGERRGSTHSVHRMPCEPSWQEITLLPFL